MSTARVVRASILVALPALVAASGDHVKPAFDQDAWNARLLADRESFRRFLSTSAQSYFAAVERVDFGDAAELVVGSAPDARVRLDDPAVKPHHVRVRVADAGFLVQAIDPGATFGTKAGDQVEARVEPSSIRVGRFQLRLSHQGFPAIIVFDPKSPHLAHPLVPDWFAPDPKLRVEARLERDAEVKEVVIQSTRGNRRKALRLGAFVFRLGDRELRLEANRLLEPGVGENDVSIFFRDATTGSESYPVGRYVEPEHVGGDAWVIDFNAAYNPACAWSEHYNCPIPPKANTLPVAVRAGAKTPIGAH